VVELLIPHFLQLQPEWPLLITNLAISLCAERDETLDKPVELVVQWSWMDTLCHIVELCRSITHAEQANPSDISLFVRIAIQHEGSAMNCGLLFRVCDLILNSLPLFCDGTSLVPDILINEFSKAFARFGAAFYLHKVPDDTTVYHQLILLQHAETVACLEDPLQLAFEGFGCASVLRHCCAPECHETFATAGRTFARCAGCGVLRCCSRPCHWQTRAWKHATLPHKEVCTKLRVLRERTCLPWGMIILGSLATDHGMTLVIDAVLGAQAALILLADVLNPGRASGKVDPRCHRDGTVYGAGSMFTTRTCGGKWPSADCAVK